MEPIKRLLMPIALLALSLPGPLPADQSDQRLDPLFETLKTSQDALELLETESEIWNIWYQSGDEVVDGMMEQAASLVSAGDLRRAEEIYSDVIDRLPEFSEGWNRRATVRYYLGDHDGSLADIEATLRLEPRHFGAIWGLGMIMGAKRDYERAILAFERLLEIKPGASDAQPRIDLLKQAIAEESI